MPNELYFDLGRVKDFKEKFPEMPEEVSMLEGAKFRFVKDPKVLAQLDLSESKIQRP